MHKYGIHRPIYTSVKPGVTGLWQVSGRNDISYEERVQLDVDYVKSMTFMFDLGLMLKTVQVVVVPTGK
jgi:lipopolysaccharide/colanic/teichoic acid biosynthesis glycosyltransferase